MDCRESFTYSAIAGREDKPVNWVSFYDSLRFVNWLENGQPVGPQGTDTTEDGAYTITEMGIVDNSITRNPGASIFLTSEDEWYKAAYYDPLSAKYFASTASSDVWTICAVPGATPNTANCDQVVGDVGDVTDVGSYTASESPNGTFDQGGNVSEWNEAILPTFPSTRGHRGGGYLFNFAALLAQSRPTTGLPSTQSGHIGFRVASVPEPTAGLLQMTCLLCLAYLRSRSAGRAGSQI